MGGGFFCVFGARLVVNALLAPSVPAGGGDQGERGAVHSIEGAWIGTWGWSAGRR